jgi:hypothetical protein
MVPADDEFVEAQNSLGRLLDEALGNWQAAFAACPLDHGPLDELLRQAALFVLFMPFIHLRALPFDAKFHGACLAESTDDVVAGSFDLLLDRLNTTKVGGKPYMEALRQTLDDAICRQEMPAALKAVWLWNAGLARTVFRRPVRALSPDAAAALDRFLGMPLEDAGLCAPGPTSSPAPPEPAQESQPAAAAPAADEPLVIVAPGSQNPWGRRVAEGDRLDRLVAVTATEVGLANPWSLDGSIYHHHRVLAPRGVSNAAAWRGAGGGWRTPADAPQAADGGSVVLDATSDGWVTAFATRVRQGWALVVPAGTPDSQLLAWLGALCGEEQGPAPPPVVTVSLDASALRDKDGCPRALVLLSKSPQHKLEVTVKDASRSPAEQTRNITPLQLLRFLAVWRASRKPYHGLAYKVRGKGGPRSPAPVDDKGVIATASLLTAAVFHGKSANWTDVINTAVEAVLGRTAAGWRDHTNRATKHGDQALSLFRLRDDVVVDIADRDLFRTVLRASKARTPSLSTTDGSGVGIDSFVDALLT